MVRGNHQWGFGASVAFSDWKTNSNVRSPGAFNFNGNQTGLPLADFMLGRVFEFRQSTPFTLDIKQKYFGLYAPGHVEALAQRHNELRRSMGAVVPAAAPAKPDLQLRPQPIPGRRAQHGVPAGASRPVAIQATPGSPRRQECIRSGLNVQPRVGVAWDPKGDGRTSVRAGYGMNSNFIAGEFYFDASQAPPFGLEQRLVNPGAVLARRSVARRRSDQPLPDHTPARVQEFPPYALLIEVPYDLDTTRIHSWNLGVQRQIGDNMGVSASYLGNYLMNVWGDVTGNPGIIPAGRDSPTGPCTLRNPARATGTQTYPELLGGTARRAP